MPNGSKTERPNVTNVLTGRIEDIPCFFTFRFSLYFGQSVKIIRREMHKTGVDSGEQDNKTNLHKKGNLHLDDLFTRMDDNANQQSYERFRPFNSTVQQRAHM